MTTGAAHRTLWPFAFAAAAGSLALLGCDQLTFATTCASDQECPVAYRCDLVSSYCVDANGPPTPGLSNLPGPLLCSSSKDLNVSGNLVVDTDQGTINGVAAPTLQVVEQRAPAPAIAVFSFARIELSAGSRLTVIGARALALLACDTVDLGGIVDVSAATTQAPVDMARGGPGGYHGGSKGLPGHGPGAGAVGEGADTSNGMQSAGSGGGAFGGAGGSGGPFTGQVAGAGGSSCGTTSLVPLLGGSGGAGQVVVAGYGPDGDHPGPGGGGGGAVQITAGTRLTIRRGGGVKAAGGGGGETGNGGGGGGGAGGAILIEAPAIAIESGAILAANGGGGAAGDCS